LDFFYVYLPSLIKIKLRTLGDPTDVDIPYQFETPLIEGAASYCAIRHPELPMSAIILHRHSTKNIARDEDNVKFSNFIDSTRATFSLWIWGLILILPDTLQDLVVSELIIFSVTMITYGFAKLFIIIGLTADKLNELFFEKHNILAWISFVIFLFALIIATIIIRRKLRSENLWSVYIPEWLNNFGSSDDKIPTVERALGEKNTQEKSIWGIAIENEVSKTAIRKYSEPKVYATDENDQLPSNSDEVIGESMDQNEEQISTNYETEDDESMANGQLSTKHSKKHDAFLASRDTDDLSHNLAIALDPDSTEEKIIEVSPWGVVTKSPKKKTPKSQAKPSVKVEKDLPQLRKVSLLSGPPDNASAVVKKEATDEDSSRDIGITMSNDRKKEMEFVRLAAKKDQIISASEKEVIPHDFSEIPRSDTDNVLTVNEIENEIDGALSLVPDPQSTRRKSLSRLSPTSLFGATQVESPPESPESIRPRTTSTINDNDDNSSQPSLLHSPESRPQTSTVPTNDSSADRRNTHILSDTISPTFKESSGKTRSDFD